MNNLVKLRYAFASAFGLDISKIPDELEYEAIPEWDSVGHMSLISSIEESFDVVLESDDIIQIASFQQAKDVLLKKGVSFN